MNIGIVLISFERRIAQHLTDAKKKKKKKNSFRRGFSFIEKCALTQVKQFYTPKF